jgi:hypothetical protein
LGTCVESETSFTGAGDGTEEGRGLALGVGTRISLLRRWSLHTDAGARGPFALSRFRRASVWMTQVSRSSGEIVYNINLISFKNILNLNNKQISYPTIFKGLPYTIF